MTRGMMGCIVPEMYMRNFGTVSYKLDIYSFGMLMMKIISGRENCDPTLETNDQIHGPEKIYGLLVSD